MRSKAKPLLVFTTNSDPNIYHHVDRGGLVMELKMASGGEVDSKSQAMWRATHAIVGRVVPFNSLLPILR